MASQCYNNLNKAIVESLAQAVVRQDRIEELQDMIVDTTVYWQILQQWRHQASGINILQLAITVDYVDFIKILSENVYRCFMSGYHRTGTSCYREANHPLLMACKLGSLQCINYFLEKEDYDTLKQILCTAGAVVYPSNPSQVNIAECDQRTPFKWCVSNRREECAKVLSSYIVDSVGIRPKISGNNILHTACYLGCPDYLKLLMSGSGAKYTSVRDDMGNAPLHVAAICAHPQCLDILLKHGAKVNSKADCRSLLHLMYSSKLRPDRFYECTKVLIKHRANVNILDKNHNTPLDYLAWEIGQNYNGNSICTYAADAAIPFLEVDGTVPPIVVEEFRSEIIRCMEVLMEAGASTMVRINGEQVDHTIAHTLLQNVGWPFSSFIQRRPDVAHRVLSLLFQYGADPNVISQNNNESAFTMLLVHSLHELPSVPWKCTLVHLFVMNGADLECHVPQPRHFRENYADRLWNIYPVMLALQERHPIEVVRLLYSFMTIPCLLHSLQMIMESYLWQRIQRMAILGLGAQLKTNDYKGQWQQLKRQLLQVRTLRHICKLVILHCLGMKGRLVDQLPLPPPVKDYLLAKES